MAGEDRVVKALDDIEASSDNTITLSSGVVLRCFKAPSLTLVKVMAAFPRPKPPVWHDPKMGRDMENPDDPDYLDRVKSWQMESSGAILNALILLGTELVSVPKGFPKPSDDSWLDEYQQIGLPIHPESKNWRYLAWVTHKAILDEKDLQAVQKVVGRLSSVPEDAVQAAEEFPGRNGKTGRAGTQGNTG